MMVTGDLDRGSVVGWAACWCAGERRVRVDVGLFRVGQAAGIPK